MSDLFASAANLHEVNARKQATQKRRKDADLFKSAWDFGVAVESHSQPQENGDSMLTIGLAKYSPDQPRDEEGRWTDEGGGSNGAHPSIASVTAAAHAVTADDPQSAEHFLQQTRDFVDAVKQGKVEPTPTMWDRILHAGGKVLEHLANGIEILAISAGAGAAIGAFAGRGISRAIGFRVGTAVAGTLAVSLLYKQWADRQSAAGLKYESARLRDNLRELESAYDQLKHSGRG